MKQILVVEDESNLASALHRGLTYKGFAVQVARSGQDALERIRLCPHDLVLPDLGLPDMDGFEMCRRLRRMTDRVFPILMLTARDAIRDKIAGLDSGADDYITKPFDFEELVAHIRAGLRRVRGKTGLHVSSHGCRGDPRSASTASLAGRPVSNTV
jgi:two-component system response regulator MprA